MNRMHQRIESTKGHSKSELAGTIVALNSRKARINEKMRILAKKMRADENIDMDDLNTYQKLNQELKDVKLWEAEMAFTRNML